MMDDAQRDRIDQFFDRIVAIARGDAPKRSNALVVAHLLPGSAPYLHALDMVHNVSAVFSKPKSTDPRAYREAADRWHCRDADRGDLANHRFVLDQMPSAEPFVLIDIGGYFAPCLAKLREVAGDNLLGVVEDTENGYRRYMERYGATPPCPIFSAARSPLKNAEDYLIGHSIVFSIEALLRSQTTVLQGRRATVIGYGKIGSSIAHLLRAMGVLTVVIDRDVIRLTEANAHGFPVYAELSTALPDSSLIVIATGQRALAEEVRLLRDGAYVASVTSADDAIDLNQLARAYDRTDIHSHIARFASDTNYFYLLNDGDAVNFLHGASVGRAILLVQSELVMSAAQLAVSPAADARFQELGAEKRRLIAAEWLQDFGDGRLS